MKNKLYLSFFLIVTILLQACAKDIVDLTGGIHGFVKDYNSENFLENCRVSLSPGGKSTSTDANGFFSFENLETGTYTLSFSKYGYGDETQKVSVVTGQISNVNVFLKLPSATTGKIAGTIKDYKNGQLISNCKVSLSPTGKSVTSSSSGAFEFTDLTQGQYSVSFTKAGYDDENTTVTVTAGKTTTVDALLKAKASFALSETSYDFGDLEASKTFYFFNYSDVDCSFNILNVPIWLSFDKTNGIVKASGNETVTAYVDRTKVSEGSYSQNVTITYSGKESGSATLSLKMKKVVLTVPTVSIASSAENVKQNSFDISGSITATGGSQITSYGHCWNTIGNPTINDDKTDLGTTDAILSYKSTASNLSTYTTYYVRAYAKNTQGIAYSEVISVTTQDVDSDIWDGRIATSFAGGSGTSIDPYIIKTGGQLLLAKNYSDKYFELGGNIDLNNKNWLPYKFSGHINGKGFTISNLFVDRIDNCQGLFSVCSGFVSNLTVKNVSINAGNYDNIGAITGEGGTITNCKVVLGNTSKIIGNRHVGGISGYGAKISKCTIESISSTTMIMGTIYIGGIIGYMDKEMTECLANVEVSGTSYVGGVIGQASADVKNCSFKGKVTGENYIGGLTGYVYVAPYKDMSVSVSGCKVDATIDATNGSAGGVVGFSYSPYDNCYLYGCYSKGTISATDFCGGLVGRGGAGISNTTSTYLCYSTMISSSSEFYGLGLNVSGKDCATVFSKASNTSASNFKVNCTNITTFLQECYSEYADYWNFNKSWVWEGNIDGSSVKVNCPNLYWE